MRAAPQDREARNLAELAVLRDRARREYLAATRTIPRVAAERSRRWRAFTEASAAYFRAKGAAR